MWETSEKKIIYKIRVFDRGFYPDPHRPFGDFENPLGQLAVPSGILKIPPGSGLRGSGLKSPLKNPNFLYKFHVSTTIYLKRKIFRCSTNRNLHKLTQWKLSSALFRNRFFEIFFWCCVYLRILKNSQYFDFPWCTSISLIILSLRYAKQGAT